MEVGGRDYAYDVERVPMKNGWGRGSKEKTDEVT